VRRHGDAILAHGAQWQPETPVSFSLVGRDHALGYRDCLIYS
jgi:hypothetical protein